ncbi:hypothetical protein [Marininema halotolerans]|nr:hypothetical protein [Marininema halotolerans]
MQGNLREGGAPFFRPEPLQERMETHQMITKKEQELYSENVRHQLLLAQVQTAQKLLSWLDQSHGEKDFRVEKGLMIWEGLQESIRIEGTS